jgi:tRNA(fMet)-specific endonuclease VapC
MTGRVLLDTNILIGLLAGEPEVVRALAVADEVFVPSVALGELHFGALKSSRAAANLERIEELAAASSVLVCDADSAREYGRIKNRLRERGRPIPENDIWIAAISRQHGLTLVTRDEHFTEIEDLPTVRW